MVARGGHFRRRWGSGFGEIAGKAGTNRSKRDRVLSFVLSQNRSLGNPLLVAFIVRPGQECLIGVFRSPLDEEMEEVFLGGVGEKQKGICGGQRRTRRQKKIEGAKSRPPPLVFRLAGQKETETETGLEWEGGGSVACVRARVQ